MPAKKYTRKHVHQGRSIYPGKDKKCHVTGIMTPLGKQLFEVARSELAMTVSRPSGSISDADVVEYLARDRQVPKS